MTLFCQILVWKKMAAVTVCIQLRLKTQSLYLILYPHLRTFAYKNDDTLIYI